MTPRVAALLLLASVLWSHAVANTDEAIDCCLRTTNRKLSIAVVKSYSIQSISGGCQIPATVLITQKGLRLCVPPATKNNWVAKIIRRLNKKSRGGKKPRTKKHGDIKRGRGSR